ncbi:MAG TPA: DNA glycosylase [Candidatus Limnocylindria bacterium]|nr:DNA glycosylase [Candidatus Limnocylindria bacterium]
MVVSIPGFSPRLTAGSGQCFRFIERAPGEFSLAAGERRLILREKGGDRFELSCGEGEYEAYWRAYLDADTDYDAFDALVPHDGSFLRRSADFARGLRILRQEPFETLVSFIISQRKNLGGIRTCVERLCEAFGRETEPGFFAFPTPATLASASREELLACGLGYRAEYVRRSAGMVARGDVDLEALQDMGDAEAMEQLLRLPGVGVKVASCVLLFAYHRLDAFPVDVWIERVLRSEYPNGFPFALYPGAAGVLQQQMFCYARHLDIKG